MIRPNHGTNDSAGNGSEPDFTGDPGPDLLEICEALDLDLDDPEGADPADLHLLAAWIDDGRPEPGPWLAALSLGVEP